MTKSGNKTIANKKDVKSFLNTIEEDQKKKDSLDILTMMKKLSGENPVMWGSSIIGFGQYHYKYASGREGDFMKLGFSPRKANISIYLMTGFENYKNLLGKLGKHKTGKSCLYIKSLKDIDRTVLEDILKKSYEEMTNKYG